MILITGASGLLGTNLLLVARRQGRDTLAVSNAQALSGGAGRVAQVDLTEEDRVFSLVERYRPRLIIHCAAATNVDWCEEHPREAVRLNVDMSRHLARAAGRIGTRLAYISTDSVYSGEEGSYSEESQPRPLNTYARTKLQGEEVVREVLPEALIVRTNIYGWNAQERKSLAEWILGELEGGRTVRGFRDVHFNPLLATDLAETLFEAIDRGATGVFHMVGAEPISKYDFARRVAETFGYAPTLVCASELAASRLRAPRPRNTTLQTRKIAAFLGRPMPDVSAGLQGFKHQRDAGFVFDLKQLVRM